MSLVVLINDQAGTSKGCPSCIYIQHCQRLHYHFQGFLRLVVGGGSVFYLPVLLSNKKPLPNNLITPPLTFSLSSTKLIKIHHWMPHTLRIFQVVRLYKYLGWNMGRAFLWYFISRHCAEPTFTDASGQPPLCCQTHRYFVVIFSNVINIAIIVIIISINIFITMTTEEFKMVDVKAVLQYYLVFDLSIISEEWVALEVPKQLSFKTTVGRSQLP